MTSIRRSSVLALAGLLAMIPILSGCLTKSTTVGDQFSGSVIIATSPDKHPQKPTFDIPASLSGQVWTTDYPEQTEGATSAAPAPTSTPPSGEAQPSPDGKTGSELSFDRLSAGQFGQLGDIIAAALPDSSATVDLRSTRSGDIVRFRGSASLVDMENDSVYLSISITFGGDVVATNGRRIGDSTVVWTPRAAQNVEMQADAEYADPATAAVPSWSWFMVVLCAIIVAMVAYVAYQNRDRSPRPGWEPTEPLFRRKSKDDEDADGSDSDKDADDADAKSEKDAGSTND
ncbi:LppM family (lipo)protein [Gordonia phthalatica]|uniref:LppM domain-containing protein n=1 Tax=Gordonia phthalatica TaxID=1136941 RepID=A0A0N9NI30_9ACTN|nr:hypothetical protein [Gordonia phthalatica]ALG85154.1 hypothetical protein ACH46_12545 [Gordonia phthalatica]